MAVLKNGMLIGNVGDLCYYVVNGQNRVRSKRKKNTTPPTDPQLASRQRIKVVNTFLKQLSQFVKIGYAEVKMEPGISAYNVATSGLLENAVSGEYPDYQLNYPRIVLSKGILLPAINPEVWAADGQLLFKWQPTQTWPNSEDLSMLAAYCPELDQVLYKLTGVQRKMGVDVLVPHPSWIGKTVETYISFRAEDKKSISTSIYTGGIILH